MGYETIRWEVSEGVATLTLNRPEVLNAITERILAELADAMKQAERETAVRAIVLTGAGRGFCAGQDLQAIKDAYRSSSGWGWFRTPGASSSSPGWSAWPGPWSCASAERP